MKVYEIAKEFNMKSAEILELLKDTSTEEGKKLVPTSNLTEDQIDYLNLEIETLKEEQEKARKEEERIRLEEEKKRKEEEEKAKAVKTEKDYKPDEMILCRSVWAGTNHFFGRHTRITYSFRGMNDVRPVEYQDLKASLLAHDSSIYNPDFVIEDENLLNDPHWEEIKHIYEDMFDENDINKVLNLPTRDFEKAFRQLPKIAQRTIVTIVASQIEDGTFEQYNKARIIDKVCGTRLDLKMA